MDYDISNDMFRIAVELVNQSSRNIFLTGKAGTGKTTFLRYIRENTAKQMAVVAPTGVAAINAGGVTIHSFFQLPLLPFVPEIPASGTFRGGQQGFDNDPTVNPHSLISRQRMNSEKILVLQQLELLVIDEVSMVRADTMDAIDTVLRHARHRPHERFGGVQVLFIGDMFQLSPVIRDDTWSMLKPYYESAYFFDSRVIREETPLYIEFKKIYRQSEERFIRVLNQVRNNELDEEGAEILNERFQPGFRRSKEDGYIVLTTHKDRVREVNERELQQNDGYLHTFNAEIADDFPPNSFPGDELLQLKKGAQVMFIKNDPDKLKRFFNGKIGNITRIENEKIYVQCKDDQDEIEVKREKWENIRYTVNQKNRQMEEEVLGSFSQFPLRLAWAITIHKSQGLTFEKAVIDVGKAFAPGQVYVALSRCTSLDGLVLQSRVNPQSLMNDPRIIRFSRSAHSTLALEEELKVARKNYQESELLAAFDFVPALKLGRELVDYLEANDSSFNPEALTTHKNIVEKLFAIQDTAVKFQQWIRQRFAEDIPVAENPALHERISRAIGHFTPPIKELITLIRNSPANTDSRLHAKEYNEAVRDLFANLSTQEFMFQAFNGPFDTESWHRHRKTFLLPAFNVNAYAGSTDKPVVSDNPILHQQLRKLRSAICAKKDLPVYYVAGTKSLDEMANYLPQTASELEQISGFGKAKVETYGEQFLELIREYCQERGLESRMANKSLKKEKKPTAGLKSNTRAETLRLFKEGMDAAAIADKRKLTIGTIETHLGHYLKNGELNINEVLSPDKVRSMDPVFNGVIPQSINILKEFLGPDISYGEIRMALAWRAFLKGDSDLSSDSNGKSND